MGTKRKSRATQKEEKPNELQESKKKHDEGGVRARELLKPVVTREHFIYAEEMSPRSHPCLNSCLETLTQPGLDAVNSKEGKSSMSPQRLESLPRHGEKKMCMRLPHHVTRAD